jgi:hypothetical protein
MSTHSIRTEKRLKRKRKEKQKYEFRLLVYPPWKSRLTSAHALGARKGGEEGRKS